MQERPGFEGPELESIAWKRMRSVDVIPASLDALEAEMMLQVTSEDPPGWREQPLYANEIIRRIMRMAVVHFTLSPDKHVSGSGMVHRTDLGGFVHEKFPASSCFGAYEAILPTGPVVFVGEKQRDDSLSCAGLYRYDHNTLRPVKDIHELLAVLGVQEDDESARIVAMEVRAYYAHNASVETALPHAVSRWLNRKGLEKPASFFQLADAVFLALDAESAAQELNALLEGTMSARHLGQHAYINELEEQFRASALTPFPPGLIRLPAGDVLHISTAPGAQILSDGTTVTFYVHPTTMALLADAFPQVHVELSPDISFYPTVGGRSGWVKQQDRWMDYQIKFDVFRMLSGWFRVCGLDTAMSETTVARFLRKHQDSGHTPPDSVLLMPTTEGAVLTLGEHLHLATLARPIPESVRGRVLVPAASLYSPVPYATHTLLGELLAGKSDVQVDSFVESTLVAPLMDAWEYFLSLEDEETGENGTAHELHGANFYYIYDPVAGEFTRQILTKDFIGNRILSSLPGQEDSSLERLIGEYDHPFGYLFLHPLVDELSRITGRPKERYDQIICDAFARILAPENKKKFLVDGLVVGAHQDVYGQLQSFHNPRQWRYAPAARFRPKTPESYA